MLRLIGILLVIGGVIAMLVPSITFFTAERAIDVGFIQIDVSKPHTIFLNPVVGAICLAVGVLMLFMGRRSDA